MSIQTPISHESWDQMCKRHDEERQAAMMRVAGDAYRRGQENTPMDANGRLKIHSINAMVAASRSVDPRAMRTPSRIHSLAHARHEVFFLAKEAGHSKSAIGRYYGLDHTTVMSGIKSHIARTTA